MARTEDHLQVDMAQSQVDPEAMFSQIYLYPWDQDPEFQSGLSSIFGNAERPTSVPPFRPDSDLLIQAQCFYYARKYNLPVTIDAAAYKDWLSKHACGEPTSTPTNTMTIIGHHQSMYPHSSREPAAPPRLQASLIPSPDSAEPPSNSAGPSTTLPQDPTLLSSSPPTAPSAPTETQPQYPTSFASIVDLITRNQPIPGVEEIPDTVLDANLSQPDKTPRRRKPWEEKRHPQGHASAVTTHGEGKMVAGNSSNGSTWMQAIERSKNF